MKKTHRLIQSDICMHTSLHCAEIEPFDVVTECTITEPNRYLFPYIGLSSPTVDFVEKKTIQFVHFHYEWCINLILKMLKP